MEKEKCEKCGLPVNMCVCEVMKWAQRGPRNMDEAKVFVLEALAASAGDDSYMGDGQSFFDDWTKAQQKRFWKACEWIGDMLRKKAERLKNKKRKR